jgi:hypothetical protein
MRTHTRTSDSSRPLSCGEPDAQRPWWLRNCRTGCRWPGPVAIQKVTGRFTGAGDRRPARSEWSWRS